MTKTTLLVDLLGAETFRKMTCIRNAVTHVARE